MAENSKKMLIIVALGVFLVGALGGCKAINKARENAGYRTFWDVKDPAVLLYKSDPPEPGCARSLDTWQNKVANFAGQNPVVRRGTSHTRVERDRIVREHMAHIDQYHEAYKMALHLEISTDKFIFDFADLGLTFAATITGGESAKSLLSAAALLVSGTGMAIDDNYLKTQAAEAIISQLDTNRNDVRLLIEKKLLDQDGVQYPIAQADVDLLNYFASGSIVNAILGLAKESADRNKKSKEKLALLPKDPVAVNKARIEKWLTAANSETKKNFAEYLIEQGFVDEADAVPVVPEEAPDPDADEDSDTTPIVPVDSVVTEAVATPAVTAKTVGTWLFSDQATPERVKAILIDMNVPQ